MPEQSRPLDPPTDSPKTLVYGRISDYELSLVFAPLAEAQLHFDLATCKDFPMTWGEFRHRFSESAYERFAAHLIENASYASFEEFLEDYHPDDYDGLSAEQAYANLPPGDAGRPPTDDDIAAFSDGDGNEYDAPQSVAWWPNQIMLEWMPPQIIAKYGYIESSVLDGEFLVLDSEREEEIVADLEALGYTCVEDSNLLNVARGYA